MEITDNDIKIINLLRRVEIGIQNIYKDLSRLELQKGIDSNEYKTKLKKLKEIVLMEEDLFDKSNDYFMSIYSLLSEITQSIYNIEEKLLNSDCELANFRIQDKVAYLFTTIEYGKKGEEIKKKIKIGYQLNLLIFSLLNNKIENELDIKLKMNLNLMKYNDIYTFKSVEKFLFNKNMKIPSIEKCMNKITKYEEDKYFLYLISELYSYNMSLFLKYKKEFYQSKKTFSVICYILNKIKTSLFLLPDCSFEKFYENIESELKDKKNLYQMNPIAVETMNQVFLDAEKERKKYRK